MLIPSVTGSFLRKFRAALGMSQADMAIIFGVNQTSYMRWEKDINPIPNGIHSELEKIFKDFLEDIATLRSGGQIDRDAPWYHVAMFWALQNELQP